ncbi:DNA pol protein [Dolichomitus sp. PSUC_FEM 10030005]|nr:DNA pol protein [Dolichomitus sp. PSUC_FEM 10030005]
MVTGQFPVTTSNDPLDVDNGSQQDECMDVDADVTMHDANNHHCRTTVAATIVDNRICEKFDKLGKENMTTTSSSQMSLMGNIAVQPIVSSAEKMTEPPQHNNEISCKPQLFSHQQKSTTTSPKTITPNALTVLRGLHENNADVILVWCLKIYPGERSLKMDYINVATSVPSTIDLKYEFSVFLVVAPSSKNNLFMLLDHAYGHLISMIYDSDLKFGLNPHTLVDTLLQTSGAERFVEYDLIRITTTSYANMLLLHDQLKKNNRHKNFYYIIEATNCNTMLAFGIMIETVTYRRQHTAVMVGMCDKLVFLKAIETKTSSGAAMGMAIRKSDTFNPQRYFAPCGLYTLQPRTKEIALVSTETASLFNLLPIVSFDIETVTDTMVDIPFGGTDSDQMSSFCLFARYMDAAMILIGYTRVFSKIAENANGHGNSNFWNDFDRQLETKYHSMYEKKMIHDRESGGPPCTIVTVRVKSVESEVKLLQLFEAWYCRGTMFQSLVPEPASNNQPHIFTGHNIIKYDMPFILRRFKWHQMHDTVTRYMREDRLIVDMPIIKFHPKAIIVDTLQIFKNHQLVSAGALKLQQLSNTFIRKTATKLDVNSVLIRVLYLLDTYYKKRSSALTDAPATNAAIKAPKSVSKAFREFARTVLSIDSDINPRLLRFSLENALSTDFIGCEYRNILSQNNPELTHISTYSIDTILRYNIVDCECVIELLYKFDYTNLFTQIIKLYPSTIEMALHGNVTARMDALFSYYSIKYKQLIPSIAKHLSVFKDRPVYTHNPDPAKLLLSERCPDASENEVAVEIIEALSYIHSCTHEIFPVISRVQHRYTKKKFSGAAVFSKSGYYENTIQFDVVSMYPSIIIAKELSLDSTDTISVKTLLTMINDNQTLSQVFDDFVAHGVVKIFIAEDEKNGVGIAKDTTILSYLYDFSCPPPHLATTTTVAAVGSSLLLENQPNIIGRMVFSCRHLKNLPEDTPLLLCTGESKNFLHSFIKDQLLERKRMQQLAAEETDDLMRRVYDSRQKAIKIAVNSMYGIFGNEYPPLAATTTLYGRKILIYAAKVLIIITFEMCIRLDQAERGDDDNFLNIYKYNYKSSIDAICNVFGTSSDDEDSNSGGGVDDDDDTMSIDTLSTDIVSRIPPVTRTRMLRLYNNSTNDVVQALIRAFYRRALLDGSDDINVLNNTLYELHNLESAWGISINSLWTAVVPKIVRELIYDGDTDGFQYQNIFNFEPKYLNQRINEEVAKALGVSRIVFEPKVILATMCMTKKKYTIIKSDTAPRIEYQQQQNRISLSQITISHNGYERNALPCLKYLCTYMAALCYYMRQQPNVSRRPLFRDIIFSFFHYLDTAVAPGELYINIPLTRQKNDSARKQFIEQYSSWLYVGSLSAVFVYSPSDPMRENLVLLERYMNAHAKHQLHYSYFFRGFGKIWLNQYLLVNKAARDTESLKNVKIVNLIHDYFQQWISKTKPCPMKTDVIDGIVTV